MILWIALGLLAAVSITPKTYKSRFITGSAAWAFLAVYWSTQPMSYIDSEDYVNAFLVSTAAALSFFIAYIIFRSRKKEEGDHEAFFSLSRAAAVGELLYFLFAEVETLNTQIITVVTTQAFWVTGQFGVPVVRTAWDELAVNGLPIQIILACTAIESIALFTGIISSAGGAPFERKLKAFLISVPVVYALNLQRLAFTASAYGFGWFGTPDESFHISEHIITKAGSLAALFIISYMVMKILPEVSDMIDGVMKSITREFKRLAGNSI